MNVNIWHEDSSDLHRISQIWVDKVYTPASIQVESASLVIDIGAHIGAFSLFAASTKTDVRVISCEPNPQNFHRLTENLQMNDSCQVTAHNLAIADHSGKTVLYCHASNSGGHSILRDGVKEQGQEVMVDCLTLEDLFKLNGVKSCDLMKMDCEGAELQIIKEAPRGLLLRIRQIAMEYHNIGPHDHRDLVDLLTNAGFAVKSVGGVEVGNTGLLYASRVPNF